MAVPRFFWFLWKNRLLLIVGVFFGIVLYQPFVSLPLSPSPLEKTTSKDVVLSPERLTFQPQTVYDDAFKKIDDRLFVYSAFYDDITHPNRTFIRIVAIDITSREWRPPLTCRFYDENQQFLKAVGSTKVKTAQEQLYRNTSEPTLTFFLCEIPQSISAWSPTPATFVQLKNEDFLKIHYHPSKGSPFHHKVAMCVQPLNFPEDKAPLFLLEWLEYYLLLGVEHITFYNYNVSQEILVLLDPYRKEGTVKVLDWPVPFPGRKVQGMQSAQWVAASDCAHRYRGVAKYVISVDTDEFLVPSKRHDNFPKYFDELWTDQKISEIRFITKLSLNNFPRGYFNADLEDERFNNMANKLLIPTTTSFFWSKQKKMVIRPDLVLESGINAVSTRVKGSTYEIFWRQDVEREGEGFLLHVRDCTPEYQVVSTLIDGGSTCLETKGVFQDVSVAKRFGKPLVERVVAKINGSSVFQKMFL